jgi:virulence-associated protein VapD
MRQPNWDKTFTHAIEIRQFRASDKTRQDYRDIIDKLMEEGGSFAVCAGSLYLSTFSLTVLKDYLNLPN